MVRACGCGWKSAGKAGNLEWRGKREEERARQLRLFEKLRPPKNRRRRDVMNWGNFRADKALEIILYVVSKGCTNMYNVLKVIYFADKEYFKKTGHTLCKDRYVAMKNGPVPSAIYNLLTGMREWSQFNNYHALGAGTLAFEEEMSYILKPLRSPNLRLFGNADFPSLDEAIARYGFMSFEDLKNFSCQEINYQCADENDLMFFSF
jgi:hypothetical protein